MIEGFLLGLYTALSIKNMLMVVGGCIIGTFIGMLPGLGPMSIIAIMIPVAISIGDPAAALILLAGVYYGAVFGGSTSSILINAPGVASTVATSFDGYPLTRQGKAGKALTIAAIASFAGGTVGALLLVFFALFVAYLSAKYTIKPINKFAKDVKKRRPADLSKVSSDVPIELLPLSQSLNSFIGRFRTALRQTETFIAEAAHHIRTPLAVVKSESELALRKSKSAENRTHLRNIIRAVDRTNRSASQLLDHAMVLYRSERPERETFKLDQAAFEVVTQLEPAANLRDLEIYYNSEISIDDIITLDRTLWETALRNLIDNAIKYASPETVVKVSVMKQKQGYDIRIINKIAGPIKTNPSQLFKKFKRGDGTAEIIGSGLGLNIVLEATNAIGGKIKFHKIRGEAICATLSLV